MLERVIRAACPRATGTVFYIYHINVMNSLAQETHQRSHLRGGVAFGFARILALVFCWVVVASGADRAFFTNSLAPMPARVAAAMKDPTPAQLAERVEIQIPLKMRD